jgi:hypothetical protein
MGALIRRLALAAVLVLVAPAARAELARVEAVGSVPLGAGSAGGSTARQDALEAGIREAILRTATELAKQAGSGASDQSIRTALGAPSAWKEYAASYRILEDRGERAPLLETSPGAEREYVVSVEVEVEQGKLRSRLAKAGVLAPPSAPDGRQTLRISFEGVDSYAVWKRIRRALAARGGAVQPLEFSHGRVLASIETDESSGAVIDRLARALGEDFELAPLGAEGDAVRVAVARRAPPEPPAPVAPELTAEPPPASDAPAAR